MTRKQRRLHLLIWLGLAPFLAGLLYLSVTLRPAPPVDDALPDILAPEARWRTVHVA